MSSGPPARQRVVSDCCSLVPEYSPPGSINCSSGYAHSDSSGRCTDPFPRIDTPSLPPDISDISFVSKEDAIVPKKIRDPLTITGRFAAPFVVQVFLGDRLVFLQVKNTEEFQQYTPIYTIILKERESRQHRVTCHNFLDLTCYSVTGFYDGFVRVNCPRVKESVHGFWEVHDSAYLIDTEDRFPVVDAHIGCVDRSWVAVVTYDAFKREYTIGVYDVGQAIGDGYKRIYALKTGEVYSSFAWFWDNSDMFVLATSKALRLYDMPCGPQPWGTQFINLEVSGVATCHHIPTLFCVATQDAVLIYDRRIMQCPINRLHLHPDTIGTGICDSIRFNPLRADELMLMYKGAKECARFFIEVPETNLSFLNRLPTRVRSKSGYLDPREVIDEPNFYVYWDAWRIARRADFALEDVLEADPVTAYGDLTDEDKENVHLWALPGYDCPLNLSLLTLLQENNRAVSLEKMSDFYDDNDWEASPPDKWGSCPNLSTVENETCHAQFEPAQNVKYPARRKVARKEAQETKRFQMFAKPRMGPNLMYHIAVTCKKLTRRRLHIQEFDRKELEVPEDASELSEITPLSGSIEDRTPQTSATSSSDVTVANAQVASRAKDEREKSILEKWLAVVTKVEKDLEEAARENNEFNDERTEDADSLDEDKVVDEEEEIPQPRFDFSSLGARYPHSLEDFKLERTLDHMDPATFDELNSWQYNHVQFDDIPLLSSFDFCMYSRTIVGIGKDPQGFCIMQGKIHHRYPNFEGGPDISLRTIVKIRFQATFDSIGEKMYAKMVNRAKRGALTYTVEAGGNKFKDFEKRMIHILDVDGKHLFFLNWLDRSFDRMMRHRALPNIPVGKPEPPELKQLADIEERLKQEEKARRERLNLRKQSTSSLSMHGEVLEGTSERTVHGPILEDNFPEWRMAQHPYSVALQRGEEDRDLRMPDIAEEKEPNDFYHAKGEVEDVANQMADGSLDFRKKVPRSLKKARRLRSDQRRTVATQLRPHKRNPNRPKRHCLYHCPCLLRNLARRNNPDAKKPRKRKHRRCTKCMKAYHARCRREKARKLTMTMVPDTPSSSRSPPAVSESIRTDSTVGTTSSRSTSSSSSLLNTASTQLSNTPTSPVERPRAAEPRSSSLDASGKGATASRSQSTTTASTQSSLSASTCSTQPTASRTSATQSMSDTRTDRSFLSRKSRTTSTSKGSTVRYGSHNRTPLSSLSRTSLASRAHHFTAIRTRHSPIRRRGRNSVAKKCPVHEHGQKKNCGWTATCRHHYRGMKRDANTGETYHSGHSTLQHHRHNGPTLKRCRVQGRPQNVHAGDSRCEYPCTPQPSPESPIAYTLGPASTTYEFPPEMPTHQMISKIEELVYSFHEYDRTSSSSQEGTTDEARRHLDELKHQVHKSTEGILTSRVRNHLAVPPPKKPELKSLPLRAMPPGYTARCKENPPRKYHTVINRRSGHLAVANSNVSGSPKHVPFVKTHPNDPYSFEREQQEFRERWKARSYEYSKRIPRFGENLIGRTEIPTQKRSRHFKKAKKAESLTDGSSSDGSSLDPWSSTWSFMRNHQTELKKRKYMPRKNSQYKPTHLRIEPMKPVERPPVEMLVEEFAPKLDTSLENSETKMPLMVKQESKPRDVTKGLAVDMPWERPTDLPKTVKTNFAREIFQGLPEQVPWERTPAAYYGNLPPDSPTQSLPPGTPPPDMPTVGALLDEHGSSRSSSGTPSSRSMTKEPSIDRQHFIDFQPTTVTIRTNMGRPHSKSDPIDKCEKPATVVEPGSMKHLQKHAAELRGAENPPFPVKKTEIPWEHQVWAPRKLGVVEMSSAIQPILPANEPATKSPKKRIVKKLKKLVIPPRQQASTASKLPKVAKVPNIKPEEKAVNIDELCLEPAPCGSPSNNPDIPLMRERAKPVSKCGGQRPLAKEIRQKQQAEQKLRESNILKQAKEMNRKAKRRYRRKFKFYRKKVWKTSIGACYEMISDANECMISLRKRTRRVKVTFKRKRPSNRVRKIYLLENGAKRRRLIEPLEGVATADSFAQTDTSKAALRVPKPTKRKKERFYYRIDVVPRPVVRPPKNLPFIPMKKRCGGRMRRFKFGKGIFPDLAKELCYEQVTRLQQKMKTYIRNRQLEKARHCEKKMVALKRQIIRGAMPIQPSPRRRKRTRKSRIISSFELSPKEKGLNCLLRVSKIRLRKGEVIKPNERRNTTEEPTEATEPEVDDELLGLDEIVKHVVFGLITEVEERERMQQKTNTKKLVKQDSIHDEDHLDLLHEEIFLREMGTQTGLQQDEDTRPVVKLVISGELLNKTGQVKNEKMKKEKKLRACEAKGTQYIMQYHLQADKHQVMACRRVSPRMRTSLVRTVGTSCNLDCSDQPCGDPIKVHEVHEMYRCRGIPGLLNFAASNTTRVEQWCGEPLGRVEVFTGPERLAIIDSIGMPNPYDRNGIRRLVEAYSIAMEGNHRPYEAVLLTMIYCVPVQLEHLLIRGRLQNEYIRLKHLDKKTSVFGPPGYLKFLFEMFSRFLVLRRSSPESETFLSDLKAWFHMYIYFKDYKYTRMRDRSEILACMTFMAMLIDPDNARLHRSALAQDKGVSLSTRLTFCALYMTREELMATYYGYAVMLPAPDRLVFLGIGPHVDSMKAVLDYADTTRDYQMATWLMCIGEMFTRPFNDFLMQQQLLMDDPVPYMQEKFPTTLLQHAYGDETRSFYLVRLRIIFERYLSFLESARLFRQKCLLKGLMVYGPGYDIDVWWSMGCGMCFEPVVGAVPKAEVVLAEEEARKKRELQAKIAKALAEGRTDIVRQLQNPGKDKNEEEEEIKEPRQMSCPLPLCLSEYPKCAICLRSANTPMVGVLSSIGDDFAAEAFCACARCGHGGHAAHIIEWFKVNKRCPSCRCKCIKFREWQVGVVGVVEKDVREALTMKSTKDEGGPRFGKDIWVKDGLSLAILSSDNDRWRKFIQKQWKQEEVNPNYSSDEEVGEPKVRLAKDRFRSITQFDAIMKKGPPEKTLIQELLVPRPVPAVDCSTTSCCTNSSMSMSSTSASRSRSSTHRRSLNAKFAPINSAFRNRGRKVASTEDNVKKEVRFTSPSRHEYFSDSDFDR